jgi:Na+/H+ antiporter NhaD/arsenite permease-like protein
MLEHGANPVSAMDMWLAGMIFIGAYALIFSEVIHRTAAGVIGAVAMVGVGAWGGFYTQENALLAMDGNTLVLLLAMMFLVAMLRPTGGFEYLAIRLGKLANGSPVRLLIYLTFAVSVISMFLDNVTTVLIFAPLTVLMTRMLNLNPMPYLMGEAMMSNIGGIATLIGDPPNLMIGSAAKIDFNTFFITMGPIVVVIWLTSLVLLLFMFREHFFGKRFAELHLDETKAIKDPKALKRILAIMAVVILLFFVHHHLHLYPSFVALIGVALGFALLREDPVRICQEVEWTVLIFFGCLFVIVGGLEAVGVLDLIGEELAAMAGNDPAKLLMTCLMIMWVAAFLSAAVDNIPFTVTMIPIIQGLGGQGVEIMPLWWALAIGVGLGGNGTHIGATANIICVAEAERSGIPEAKITPTLWLRKGLPIMVLSLVVASIVYATFFSYFRA